MRFGLAPLPILPWNAEKELDRTTVSLDSLDRRIIASLAVDGHQSNREVAMRLAINETTVRARVGRLEASGLVRLVAVADPLNMGLAGATAMIKVRLSGRERPEAIRTLVTESGVAAYLSCVGASDVVVVTADSHGALLDLIAKVREATSATEVSAFTVVGTLKHRAHLTRLTNT
jgi:Lrp/AsnC family transcriptional regulator for asnA, asnC and gidA